MTFRPPDFESLLARLTEDIEAQGLNFMLIGGQAVLLHGRPRLTEDIELTLAAGPESLSRVLVACRNLRLEPLPEDVEAFVRKTFVLPAAEPETGIRVDFIFSTIRYERQAIERAVRVELKGVAVPFATAEDLILHKLFARRALDLEDATAVVHRQRDKLDWAYLERWGESSAEIVGYEDLPDRLRQLKAS